MAHKRILFLHELWFKEGTIQGNSILIYEKHMICDLQGISPVQDQ